MAGDHVCSGLFPGQLMVPGDSCKRTWSKCQRCLVHLPKGACPSTVWTRLFMAGDHVCSGLFPGQLMVPGDSHKRTWSICQRCWSICHKVPVLQLHGPGYLWQGTMSVLACSLVS